MFNRFKKTMQVKELVDLEVGTCFGACIAEVLSGKISDGSSIEMSADLMALGKAQLVLLVAALVQAQGEGVGLAALVPIEALKASVSSREGDEEGDSPPAEAAFGEVVIKFTKNGMALSRQKGNEPL
jgi:hypothetical protein